VDGREHWQPVLAGRGSVSFREAIDALNNLNYEGYISFEWEKYWHREIEEPEIALPDFIGALKQLFPYGLGKRNAAEPASLQGS
jgi:sugar phosphate isomerase/epimerase